MDKEAQHVRDVVDDADRDTLRWRAMKLARSSKRLVEQKEIETFLEFRMMGMRYAVYLDRVLVVKKVDEVFSLPNTPSHITGVIRHRGQPVALISLPHFLYPDARGIADADYAIVVLAQRKRFALQVEDIEGVSQLDKASLSIPSDSLSSEQLPYISAVTTEGLAVIDLEKFVQAERFDLS